MTNPRMIRKPPVILNTQTRLPVRFSNLQNINK
jgi:hypothetical protein